MHKRHPKVDCTLNFNTIASALAMQEKLMLNGIRYRPNYKIAIANHPALVISRL
ncbi:MULTISPECIES: hypothetical protein [Pseudanabaena]|jgi:hypothetical protein|uniref:hypothetical protein n=1 Tax=Pseudanabaena TaxID=1152 RepID=UPI00247A22CC|nr:MULTISPECIES: hypothetical protein [Pseudanabaena]MEA5488537.1 hypothetical protein [Pseudanabaena sp. CCNP1317]WGS71937.1 hypothetical protein OA858_19875 [Pseudanabaena galeata CCNP1313]